MKKVFSIERKIFDRKPTDDLNDLDVNAAVCFFFMSVTRQAAVHLGKDYAENLRSTKNQFSKSVVQLFLTTEKLIKDQTVIEGLSTIDWVQPVWRESSLPCDGAVRNMKSNPTSFPTRCFAWEASVTSQSKLGKTRSNVFLGNTPSQRIGSN